MKRLNWEGLKYYHEKLVRMLESWQLANQQMISTAYTEGDNITIENGIISAEIPDGLATEQWVEEQGYIKSIPPHTVTINFYNDIDYAVWHNMVGDIEITSMQSTNVLDLYVSDDNNLNKQDVEIALDNGPISITNGSTLTFDVIKAIDANGFAAVTLTYNIK